MQEKIAETKDNTGASFQRATIKTTTDSLLQRMNRPGRPPMPIPVIGAGGTHPDSPGNVSAATGFTRPSTATETGNDLAAKIILRHGSKPGGRLSDVKTKRLRLFAAMNGRIAPDTDLPLPSARSGSEITVSGKFASLPPRGPIRSVSESMTSPALSRLSSGYHYPTMAAGQPSRIVSADTRQPVWLQQSASIGSLPVGITQTGQAAESTRMEDKTIPSTDMRSADEVSVRSFAHGHAAAGAFARNRIWPQMMIHRAFVAAGVAGSSSGASEHPVNNSSGSVANRPLAAMRGMMSRGYDAMSLTMNAGRLFHSTADNSANRSLVQLSVSDRPALAEGGLMRSSEFQFGSVLDGESRPREPHDGGSESNPSGSADLEQLVDKVLQKLMRRIAVEKERRGLQRWP